LHRISSVAGQDRRHNKNDHSSPRIFTSSGVQTSSRIGRFPFLSAGYQTGGNPPNHCRSQRACRPRRGRSAPRLARPLYGSIFLHFQNPFSGPESGLRSAVPAGQGAVRFRAPTAFKRRKSPPCPRAVGWGLGRLSENALASSESHAVGAADSPCATLVAARILSH
jgi:hypothetical protein